MRYWPDWTSKHLHNYVCDFPTHKIARPIPGVIALPHLGASTQEAEDNCAVMVAEQLRDYLEHGNVVEYGEFPQCLHAARIGLRLAIANANVPNMLGQISSTLAAAGINIHNMMNKSRGEMAYTLVDTDSAITRRADRADRRHCGRADGARSASAERTLTTERQSAMSDKLKQCASR